MGCKQDETDIDCGGSCLPCANDFACLVDAAARPCAPGRVVQRRAVVTIFDKVARRAMMATRSPGCDYGAAACRVCAADCTQQDGAIRVCGDDVNDPEEECDDGNTVTEGAITAQRRAVLRGRLYPARWRVRVCGDDVSDPEEECDDGNTVTVRLRRSGVPCLRGRLYPTRWRSSRLWR